jgi:acetyl esterase/lipase
MTLEAISPVTHSYGQEPDQIYELYSPSESNGPVVILIHGGYWRPIHDREHMRPLAAALAAAGFTIALAEYRRIPGDPMASMADLHHLYSHFFPHNVVLVGFSAGGQLAIATTPFRFQVSGILALAPVTDLIDSQERGCGEGAVNEWLGKSAIECEEFDPIRMDPLDCPVFIIHGTNDDRVPVEHSRAYAHKHGAALLEIADLGHLDLMAIQGESFEAIVQALNILA